MAWALLGLGAFAVISYVGSEISNVYGRATKPIYDYFEQRETEANINEREEVRQQRIIDAKQRKAKTNATINKIGIKAKNIVSIINNTDEPIDIIFVNLDRATTSAQAIDWAKQVITTNVFNKTNTKHDILSPNSTFELVKQEMTEYHIVLRLEKKFIVLDQTDFDMLNITVKNKFNLRNVGTDTQCNQWL